MGLTTSQDEVVLLDEKDEFLIHLQNPSDLLKVCAGLEARQMHVDAIDPHENYLWVEPNDELKLELEQNTCLGFPTYPCAYQPKGTHYMLVGHGKTAYDLQQMINKFEADKSIKKLRYSPSSSFGDKTIYFTYHNTT